MIPILNIIPIYHYFLKKKKKTFLILNYQKTTKLSFKQQPFNFLSLILFQFHVCESSIIFEGQ